jgi:hypothetical protein
MLKTFINRITVNKAMLISAFIFYCLFTLYLLFSRQPNYFNSLKAKGIVVRLDQQQIYSGDGFYVKSFPVVHFKTETDSVEVSCNVDEYLTTYFQGDVVTVIYKGRNQGKAAILAFIGYWVTLNELMASLVICALVIGLTKLLYHYKLR